MPSVTLRGERLVRRVGASTITTAGHPEWVAENLNEYVEIAGRLLAERGPHLRTEFLASHVCDGEARTRAFEDAVREGRGVLEMSDPKATTEFEAFTREVMTHGGIQQALAEAS